MDTTLLSVAQLRQVARERPKAAARFLRALSQSELAALFERWVAESRESREALADELQRVIEQGDNA